MNSVPKPASIAARDLSYDDLDTRLTGRFYWDQTRDAPQPGILLAHGGAGLDDHAREQARRYAELGYAVLACDMFGEGVTGNRERIMACLHAMRDDPASLARRRPRPHRPRAMPRNRPRTGRRRLLLRRNGRADPGTVGRQPHQRRERPRQSLDGTARRPGAVRAKVLVCHGASDPHVPMNDVIAFAQEMNRARADWQLTVYGNALHGFTHRHTAPGATPGVAYDPLADERSFAAAHMSSPAR